MEDAIRYGLRIVIEAPFTDALAATRIALADAGFSVVMDMDVRATFKRKLDVEFEPYVIFGVCNPALALRALNANRDLGLLLPCHVVVRAEGERSVVEAVDPLAMIALARPTDEVREVAIDARSRLLRVLAELEEAAAPRGQVLHA
ncbi:MAG TPA: DUF302 domain-containing protein [Thermoanaerobaculia bacterium]|nr:DUF302 domain-containing protein [Thermoanaerobaculia bacterium]